MKKDQPIPEVTFPNRQKKDFEFGVVTNYEVLRDNLPTTHNPFRPHRVHFYVLLFITEGEGWHFIDFKKYPYKRGSIFLPLFLH